jgi:DNA-binding response OmpR family regulator
MLDRVLVVHHERIVAEIICSFLLEANYDATLECSSEGALQNAKEFPPSLMIIDPIMPSTLGIDVAKEVFAKTGCKVLLISTGADQEGILGCLDELRSLGCDADSFLTPFEKPQLLLQVRNQITRKASRR